MLVDDVGLLHVIVAKVEERHGIDNTHFIARGIALGTFVGRQESIIASAISQSANGFHNQAFASSLRLAEEGIEVVLGVETFGQRLMEHVTKGGKEVLLSHEGIGDNRANVALPIHEEGNARACLKETIFSTSISAVPVVTAYETWRRPSECM